MKERTILRTPKIQGKTRYIRGYTGCFRKVQKMGWRNRGKGQNGTYQKVYRKDNRGKREYMSDQMGGGNS